MTRLSSSQSIPRSHGINMRIGVTHLTLSPRLSQHKNLVNAIRSLDTTRSSRKKRKVFRVWRRKAIRQGLYSKKCILFLFLYVDYILIVNSSRDKIDMLKEKLNSEFETKDFCIMKKILGEIILISAWLLEEIKEMH
ncbi:hypothetical protein CR513_45057, partial [Mucuna pruriens]